jgi:hypothetical protein
VQPVTALAAGAFAECGGHAHDGPDGLVVELLQPGWKAFDERDDAGGGLKGE